MDDIVTAARRVMRADRRMMELSGDELRAAITAFRAAGYAVVPREPTDAMGAAGLKASGDNGTFYLTPAEREAIGWKDHLAGNPSKWMNPIYRAMVAAAEAPKPEDVTAPKKLDDKGRCCGRKPLVYKVPQHRLFCARCDAQYDPQTGIQVANWAYRAAADGFAKVYANAKAPEETT